MIVLNFYIIISGWSTKKNWKNKTQFNWIVNSTIPNEKNTVNDEIENKFHETALVHRDVAEFIDKVDNGKKSENTSRKPRK